MKKFIIFSLIFVSINATSQEIYKKCITPNIVKQELENNKLYEFSRQQLYKFNNKNKYIGSKNRSTTTLPVVIHIVHRSQDNIGNNTNISDAQIESQLLVLNEDYSKTNPEFPNPPRSTFLNNAGNPQIQFCLATEDPNGNPTTGITRTATSQFSWDADDPDEQNYMKLTSQGGIDNWDPLRYINIWVCNLSNSSGGGQTLGYAYLPGLQSSSQSWKDGLVVDYRFFGTVGNVSASSDGRTATHEIGHYLGLSHTFCESSGCCDNDLNGNYSWGDVDDTPATEDIYFGPVNFNTNNNTCNDLSYSNIFNTNVLDMDENYMSYSSNTWMFSEGQVDVMLGTLSAPSWQGGRINLTNSNISVNCNGVVSSSWDCNSLGICTDPGTGNGTYSSYNACLSACGCTGNYSTISEGFQATSLPNDWSIDNPDGDQTWAINSSYGFNSSSSICIENSIYSANGEYDDLNSPMMNFNAATSITLDFDYAYSLWTDPNLPQNWSDTLIILVSSDCGLTWQRIWERAGADLVTTTPIFNGTEWFPANNNDWDSESINLNNYANQDAIMIKFRNVNQYENNLFIDNINITSNGSLSVDEDQMNRLLVYPNPADKQIDVNHKGLKQIYNMLGERVIYSYDNKIDISNLAVGVYVIKLGDISIRLIKQ